MEQYDKPVADRYHSLTPEVRLVLAKLHGHAATEFQRMERSGIKPIRGVLRTDPEALNDTAGLAALDAYDTIDIARMFNLHRRYQGSKANISLGLSTYTDPETDKAVYDLYATKEYQKYPRLKKFGAFATRLAQRWVQ